MKRILLMALCCACLFACQQKPDGYTINGEIAGKSDGMKVTLQNDVVYPPVVVDSTIIQNGKFRFEGKLELPGMYQIVIDKGGEGSSTNWLASRFYLENSDITFSGHIDSLPTYYWSQDTFRKEPIIKGSATQDLYNRYQKETAANRKRNSDLFEEYLKVYHVPSMDGVFNTDEGIRISREQAEISKKLDIAQWDFIEKNAGTVVGYDLATLFLEGMYVNLTVPQIEQLTEIITKAWANNPTMADGFKVKAEKAKVMALGAKYQDIELMNTKGEMVKLSDYVPEGKYVMLEFWASWCGPCRGEIPHLRHVYKDYKDKGFEIVSISIDEKKKDWEKAMKEEGMVWTQLCDPKGFEGPVAKKYNVSGVPTCIILDKEGRIFKTDMRGAALDAVLQELYD